MEIMNNPIHYTFKTSFFNEFRVLICINASMIDGRGPYCLSEHHKFVTGGFDST